MATETTAPAAFTAHYTYTTEWMRENGREAEVFYLTISKTGRVGATEKAAKAARFATEADAREALATRQAYHAKGKDTQATVYTWHVSAA